MSETMVERVANAIDAVQIWSRFNDWTTDRVEGLPVEICRYGVDGEPEIVILKRLPAASEDTVFHGAAKCFNAILDAALATPGEG